MEPATTPDRVAKRKAFYWRIATVFTFLTILWTPFIIRIAQKHTETYSAHKLVISNNNQIKIYFGTILLLTGLSVIFMMQDTYDTHKSYGLRANSEYQPVP